MGLKKDQVTTAAVGLAGAVGGALTTYAALRASEENGLHHIVTLARQKIPLRVHRATRYEMPNISERKEIDLEILQGAKIIYAGDSQGMPTNIRIKTATEGFTPHQPGTMDACAAEELHEAFGLDVISENYGEPGAMDVDLLERLRDHTSSLYKALIESEEASYVMLSIGLNKWQKVASNPGILETTSSLGAERTGRRNIGKEAITVVRTLLSLAKGHQKVGEELEGVIHDILQEVMDINTDRVTRGKKAFLGVGLLCPADFGEAYAITVGQPKQVETTTIVIDGNSTLRRLGSMVSSYAGRQIERGMHAKEWDVPVHFVSSEGVEFQKPSEETQGQIIDQHLGYGPKGVRQLGKNLAAMLVHIYGKVKEVIPTEITTSQVA